MKKNVLLTSAMAFACAGAFAQSADLQANKMVKFDFQKNLQVSSNVLGAGKIAKTPMRASADGVRYTRPEGSLWLGLSADLMGYNLSVAIVPAYREVVFTNASTVAGTKWYAQTASGLTDASDYADENNNYHASYPVDFSQNAWFNAPVLASADGKTQFTLGEWNTNGGAVGTANIGPLSPTDHNLDGYAFAQSGFGANSYFLGTGSLKSGSFAGYTLTGFMNFYPAPMAPLYVEDVHLAAYSSVATPIKDGQTLTLTFYGVTTGEDGKTQVDANNIIGKMTATATDYSMVQQGTSQYTSTGNVYVGGLTFTAKGTDIFGNPTTEPIVLNQPYCIVMDGLAQDGLDIAFVGYEANTEDVESSNTGMAVSNAAGDATIISYQGGNVLMDYNFTGGFDYIEPMETAYFSDGSTAGDINVLKVSADGKTVTNAGYESANYAILNTAFEWYDENGTEQYSIAMPDWVESYSVESVEDNDGEYTLIPQCKALPDGVKGRAAKVYMSGKGYGSETPLYILQGDATKDEAVDGIQGVENVKTVSNSRTYNLAGQQVGKDFKGIVVKDGKKFLKK